MRLVDSGLTPHSAGPEHPRRREVEQLVFVDSRFAHRTVQKKHRREMRPLRGRESVRVADTRAVGLEVPQDAGPAADPVGPVTQQVAALLVGDMADRLRESDGQASWVESAAGWARKELRLALVIRVAGAMGEDPPL